MRSLLGFVLVAAACLLLLPSACAPGDVEVVNETDEKQYQLGKNYLSQGRIEEALAAFQRVIDARRDAPESHLEAGHIYLRDLKDPVRAIYYFDQYLRFKPNSPQASQVLQLIETAEKEFARQLPAQPYEGDLDRIDLMELVKTLKQENEALKQDLAGAKNRVEQLESMVGEARRVPPPQGNRPSATRRPERTASEARPSNTVTRRSESADPETAPQRYTVQSGDTLSSISRQVYGTPSRWIDIYQANRDRLADENALKVGQELRIP